MDVILKQKQASFSVPENETSSSSSTDKSRRVSLFTCPPSKEATDGLDKLKASDIFRRRSTFKGLAKTIQTVLAFKKLTRLSGALKPTKNFENTYRITPDNGGHFNAEKVERAVLALLQHQLSDVKYEPKRCTLLTRKITDMVKKRVKMMDFQRYKLVCNVMLGQCSDQGMEAVSRCLWDSKTDGCACTQYKNDSLFVVVTVYGVYFE